MESTNKIFENIVQEIKDKFTSLDQGAEYYRVVVMIPAINFYINGAHGALFAPNSFVCISSMRMMLEAIGALAYFEDVDPSNEVFNLLISHGRICGDNIINIGEVDKEKLLISLERLECLNSGNQSLKELLNKLIENLKKERYCSDISVRRQLCSIDKVTGYRGAKSLYDEMCSPLHFGSDQMLSALRESSWVKDNNKLDIKWEIGLKPLSDKSRLQVREMVLEFHNIMLEVLDYSASNNHSGTNRFNYRLINCKKNVPKEYRDIFAPPI